MSRRRKFATVERSLPTRLGDLLLRQPEVVVELVIRHRLFDRVEVLALDVLDERDLQRVALGHHLFDDDRDGGQAGLLRGAEAALAGDELVLVAGARDDERLDDAVLADAARQLFDRRFVERLARLEGIRLRSARSESRPDPASRATRRAPPAAAG